MPAPDPFAIELSEDGRIWYSYRVGPTWLFPFGAKLGSNEKRNRDARAKAIAMNIRRDNWGCWWCGEEIGLHRRADARFCRERCRKAQARERRRYLKNLG